MSDFEDGRKRGWEECLEHVVAFLDFAADQVPPEFPRMTINESFAALAEALEREGLAPSPHISVNPPCAITIQNYSAKGKN